jgi:hypothetical protein
MSCGVASRSLSRGAPDWRSARLRPRHHHSHSEPPLPLKRRALYTFCVRSLYRHSVTLLCVQAAWSVSDSDAGSQLRLDVAIGFGADRLSAVFPQARRRLPAALKEGSVVHSVPPSLPPPSLPPSLPPSPSPPSHPAPCSLLPAPSLTLTDAQSQPSSTVCLCRITASRGHSDAAPLQCIPRRRAQFLHGAASRPPTSRGHGVLGPGAVVVPPLPRHARRPLAVQAAVHPRRRWLWHLGLWHVGCWHLGRRNVGVWLGDGLGCGGDVLRRGTAHHAWLRQPAPPARIHRKRVSRSVHSGTAMDDRPNVPSSPPLPSSRSLISRVRACAVCRKGI